MVLFSLILAVGMLVDDAIISPSLPSAGWAEGKPPKEAYALAAKRMSGPVIAATATRIAAFSPLLFWPGVVGEFMNFLPITLIATLSASLAGGAVFHADTRRAARQGIGPAARRTRPRGWPLHADRAAGAAPARATLALAALLLVVVLVGYGKFRPRRRIFRRSSPTTARSSFTHAAIWRSTKRDRFLAEAEKRVLQAKGLKTVYTRVGEQPKGSNELSEDTIGVIQFEFSDWARALRARDHGRHIRTATAEIPGILVEVTAPRAGPPTGKPIQVQIGGRDPELLRRPPRRSPRCWRLRSDIQDLDDGLPLPGIDWKVHVDQPKPRSSPPIPATVGTALQLVTNGIKATNTGGRQRQGGRHSWCVSRGPAQSRSDRRAAGADAIRLGPISNFVERQAAPRVGFTTASPATAS